MPPRRGRGRGKGPPQNKSPENIPFQPESSRSERGRGNRGRGRYESAVSAPGRDGQQSSYPTEKPRDNVPTSKPPTSATEERKGQKVEPTAKPPTSAKEERKGQKVDPEDIGFKFQQLSLNDSRFPKRPGFGKLGRHIRVVSNCYPINFPSGYVYHYYVDVIDSNQRKTPDPGNKKYRCLNTKRNREVIDFMLKHDPVFKGICGAFDGRNHLLTKQKLKINLPFTCNVTLSSENQSKQSDSRDAKYDCFKVEIAKLVSTINLESIRAFYDRRCNDLPQEAIMALELILRHEPSLKFTPIGRSFFYPPGIDNITPFGGGLEIWFGYHQGVRLSQWKPTVNLNTTATTFWKGGPVLNFIAEYKNVGVRDLHTLQLNRFDIKMLNKKLKQKQIKVTHLSYGRKRRILKLREKSANEEKLRENGVETRKTVSQYFKETYKRNLVYGNLPCLQVQPENKYIFLPVEVCEFVPGQHYKGDITAAQKAKMIEFTSNPPYEKFKKIQDIFHKANYNKSETVKGFGVEISDKPVVADARVLNPPSLVYKDRYNSDKQVHPRNGSWDVRETHFIQGAKIPRWALLSFKDSRYLDDFADVLVKIGKNLGLQISAPSDIIIKNVHCDKLKLFRDLKNNGVALVVVIIPTCDEREEKRIYAEIKNIAETGIGLATQCMKAERLRDMAGKRGPQIASNLCLKINAKLGGENHSLFERDIPSILCKPVIIIGADVNHPAPTQLDQPSIAACVGSLDCLGKRFAVSIRAQVNSNPQKKKVEQICDLEEMMRELLLAFYHHTRKKKPEKIIFYRDGVSEGELATVKHIEVACIRAACDNLEPDYKPGITVIVVQKRHHVRFRPDNPREGSGRMNNLPPGTVIDTEVTHPVNFDFFLCSQFGLQGTSRPSHYLVVEDDNDFSADELQKLTFHMCHMYVRCTKSISIPAPVAYADLVAYRARKHLNWKKGDDSDSGSEGYRNFGLTQEDIDAIKVVDNLKDSMYFV